MYVFFFKQKTAYEMRISDWSSDVCSSDLAQHRGAGIDRQRMRRDHDRIGRGPGRMVRSGRGDLPAGCTGGQRDQQADGHAAPGVAQDAKCHAQYSSLRWERPGAVARAFVDLRPEVEETGRSEEHTTETQ